MRVVDNAERIPPEAQLAQLAFAPHVGHLKLLKQVLEFLLVVARAKEGPQ
jgi:hypothetical protein